MTHLLAMYVRAVSPHASRSAGGGRVPPVLIWSRSSRTSVSMSSSGGGGVLGVEFLSVVLVVVLVLLRAATNPPLAAMGVAVVDGH